MFSSNYFRRILHICNDTILAQCFVGVNQLLSRISCEYPPRVFLAPIQTKYSILAQNVDIDEANHEPSLQAKSARTVILFLTKKGALWLVVATHSDPIMCTKRRRIASESNSLTLLRGVPSSRRQAHAAPTCRASVSLWVHDPGLRFHWVLVLLTFKCFRSREQRRRVPLKGTKLG